MPTLAYATAGRGAATSTTRERSGLTWPLADQTPTTAVPERTIAAAPDSAAGPSRHAALPVATQRTHYWLPAAADRANRESGAASSNASSSNADAQPAARRANHSTPIRRSGGAGHTDSSIAYSVLAQLNSERAAHGLRALSMNSELVSSAHAHNLTMARHDSMSHQLPGEAYFADRIVSAGYHYQDAGENIGWNSGISRNAALSLETDMYAEGPPPKGADNHYSNIVGKQFTDVGIDVYIDTVHHKLWLTEDFGGR